MAGIYLETDINDSLRALVDYDSDGQSLTTHRRGENEIQVEIHKEESAEDKDFNKLTFNKYHYLLLSRVC